jgi:hypothetical protein
MNNANQSMTHANSTCYFVEAVELLISEVENNGGASLWANLRALETKSAAVYLNCKQTGYSVGNNKYSNLIQQWYSLTHQQKVDQLLFSILDLSIRHETVTGTYPCLGLWLDSSTGTLYVDPITHVEELATAMNLGATNGELAIWDLALAREIRLN